MKESLKGSLERYLPAVGSGILLVFSFPTFDLFPLAWFALVPFLVSLWNREPRVAFLSGFFLGVPYFFGTLYWVYHSISHYGGVPFAISLFLVLLLSLYLSLYPGLFALLFSQKLSSSRLPALLLAPVFWVTLEYLRSYALTGFPWSSLGYSQYRFLYGIQIADITGIYGISFLVVAINGAIADIFIEKKRYAEKPLSPQAHAFVGYITFAVLVISVLGYGFWRIHQQRPGAIVRASVIQGNIGQDVKWEPASQEEIFGIYKNLTEKAAAASPSLVVWPEASLPFYFRQDTARSENLLAFKQTLSPYLLFGTVLVKEPPKKQQSALLTNSAVLLDSGGNISYIYDKIHLVPFGEYIPFRSILFFVDKVVAGIGDYVTGDKLIKAYTPFGSFGTFICYEIIFPGLVRKFYSRDGDFIVTITNDGWFGKTAGPYQHFSMAVFRAIENRKPVIRAANTGVSGFIDSTGRIIRTTALFERTVETMDVMTDTTLSFYSKYGDIFSYICIVCALLLLL